MELSSRSYILQIMLYGINHPEAYIINFSEHKKHGILGSKHGGWIKICYPPPPMSKHEGDTSTPDLRPCLLYIRTSS